MKSKVIIIGAGLTGLTLAYYLKKKNVEAVLLEARDRVGGRIHTLYTDKKAPLEMGATWLGRQHTSVSTLIEELGGGTFVQRLGNTAIYEPISTSPAQLVQLPPNDEPSYRIQGGSSQLINMLKGHLDTNQINLNQVVKSIEIEADHVRVKTSTEEFLGDHVVSTLPPYLLSKSIKITPPLHESVTNIAQQTHTWMGESIKIAIRYTSPFWREDQTSGTIFSNVGPITEFYDHSDDSDQYFALKGFMNGAYNSATQEERKAAIMNQLNRLLGPKALKYESYHETVWAHEQYTYQGYDQDILPHQNNGNPVFRQSIWNDRFIIAGSETSHQFPGYMDGAVISAKKAYQNLIGQS